MAESDRYWDPRMETMGREELATVQGHRLRWQVGRCWDGSAFYRERFEAAGLAPADVLAPDQVARLPILRPEELAEDRRRHPPHGRAVVAPPDRWARRAPVIWSVADAVNAVSLAARALWSFGARSGSLLVEPGPAAADPAVETIVAAARKIGLAVGRRRSPAGAAPADGIVLRAGAGEGPEGAEPGGQDGPAAIWGGAETTSEPPGAGRPFRVYGSLALGPTAAAECPARAGLHWAEDHLLVETLDPATLAPVPPGEPGALVVTHLTREAGPLLRYWTGHTARLDRSRCACGRTHARSPAVLGNA